MVFQALPCVPLSVCITALEHFTRLLLLHPVNARFFHEKVGEWPSWLLPLLLPMPQSLLPADEFFSFSRLNTSGRLVMNIAVAYWLRLLRLLHSRC